MRLLMASCEPGPTVAAELARLAGPEARVGIALDAVQDPPRGRLESERRALGALGEKAVAVDLGDLVGIDVLWVVGGNWHALWRAMAPVSGVLAARVRDGSLVYGGWSAGAVAAGPLVVEDGRPAWGGLGVIDITVIPHYGSDEGAARIAAQLRATRRRFAALRDGQALVVDGAAVSLIGRCAR
jgi:dipeptidase E